MTNTARDVFITGLRNAHAMEVQARELMERQSERLGDYPDVQARVKQHLAETNQHLKRLDTCLQACGESSSSLKDTAQSVVANTMAMAHAMAGDEILKNTFANTRSRISRLRPTSRCSRCATAPGSKARVPCSRRTSGKTKRWRPGSTPMSAR
jgi:ferritin-like metal-binding protein YciE